MNQSYPKKDMSELQAEAQAGNVAAQNSLGMLHELGLIPKATMGEAMQWYGKAVKAGDPQAALALASIHENEVPKAEPKMIAALYAVAAKQGFRSPRARADEVFIRAKQAIVLLVERSENSRRMTAALLAKNSYQVLLAEDAFCALRFIENGQQVDLVLSDQEMPDMDGIEMLQLIRRRYQKTDLPVILISGSRDLELLKKAKSFSLQGWILKPYDNEILIQTVQKSLQAKKSS